MARKLTEKAVRNKTIESMTSVGTYKDEFLPTIERYAELFVEYNNLKEDWEKDGRKITEPYTNKAGATNIRKTALYLALESLRKELLELEDKFGLTPAGLKKIKTEGLKTTAENKLTKILEGMNAME